MADETTVTADNKYLQIKENNGYYYAERLGVDSVAFVLYNKDTDKVGLIKEFKPPIDKFLTTAFGGSIDKDLPLNILVEEEVREEAGYRGAKIQPLGKMFVSTQMNQFCHLYLATVEEMKFVGREPQTEMEAEATVEWLDPNDLEEWYNTSECWKAMTIITKAAVVGVISFD